MIEEVLTWETNRTLTYPREGGVGHYEDDWQLLILTMETYEANAFFSPFDVKPSFEGLPGDDWKPLTDEGVKKYLGLRIAAIEHNDRGVIYMLTGKARLSRDDSITVAAVEGAARDAKVPADFRSRFEHIEVRILGGEKDERGFLRYRDANDEWDESLTFDITVQNDRLRELVETITRCPKPPVLTISMRAMLFEASWRGLAPYDFPTEYIYPADWGFRLALLSSIRVNIERRTELDPVTKEPVALDDVPAPVAKLSDEMMHLLKRINQGIWALVGMIGVTLVLSRWF